MPNQTYAHVKMRSSATMPEKCGRDYIAQTKSMFLYKGLRWVSSSWVAPLGRFNGNDFPTLLHLIQQDSVD